jgi:hypothetical protein
MLHMPPHMFLRCDFNTPLLEGLDLCSYFLNLGTFVTPAEVTLCDFQGKFGKVHSISIHLSW